jgi:DNA-binding MarR family transcriptional regulator
MHMQGEMMVKDIDCLAVSASTSIRLRRAARMTTQVIDTHLAPSGLTIGQFGILTQIYGSSLTRPALTMKELSSLIGMDPTTLNRTLKPLETAKLIRTAAGDHDRRARCIYLTAAGKKKLIQAMPLWRAGEAELRQAIGTEMNTGLSGLLGLINEKLGKTE